MRLCLGALTASLPLLTDAITGRKLHFQFDDLVPLRVCPLTFRNRQQLPQATPRIEYGCNGGHRCRVGHWGLRGRLRLIFSRQVIWLVDLIHDNIIAQVACLLASLILE